MSFAEQVTDAGIAHVRGVISAETLQRLRQVFEKTPHGMRNLLEVPEIRVLAGSEEVAELVSAVLGRDAFAVRAILFDKHSGANWKSPVHQDLTIAVRERGDAEGFGPWTVKARVQHVQPPEAILQQMVSVRIHLDDSTLQNGPLYVFPGSHRPGRLSEQEIDELRANGVPETCLANASDALVMRPLLVHGSPSCVKATRRRVIHMEFANVELHAPLQWHDRVPIACAAHV